MRNPNVHGVSGTNEKLLDRVSQRVKTAMFSGGDVSTTARTAVAG